MKSKYCIECGAQCYIDEWNGWLWQCVNCDAENRAATDKEIEELEAEK